MLSFLFCFCLLLCLHQVLQSSSSDNQTSAETAKTLPQSTFVDGATKSHLHFISFCNSCGDAKPYHDDDTLTLKLHSKSDGFLRNSGVDKLPQVRQRGSESNSSKQRRSIQTKISSATDFNDVAFMNVRSYKGQGHMSRSRSQWMDRAKKELLVKHQGEKEGMPAIWFKPPLVRIHQDKSHSHQKRAPAISSAPSCLGGRRTVHKKSKT